MRLLAFAIAISMAPLAAHAAPAVAVSPPALDPARVEKARTLVEIILPTSQRQVMFSKFLDSYMGNMLAGIMQADPKLGEALSSDAILKGIFASFVARQRALVLKDLEETSPELTLAYANAYARRFTVAELDEITAFLSSATGRKYAASSIELASDPDIGAWQQNITVRAQTRKGEEVKKFMGEIIPHLQQQQGAHSHGS